MFSLRTRAPFSYIDPLMGSLRTDGSKSALVFAKEKLKLMDEDPSKYDFWAYEAEGVAGGCKVTKTLLNASPSRMSYVVMHEDVHDRNGGNIRLPSHIEEASCDILSNLLALRFWKANNEKIKKSLDKLVSDACIVNACVKDLQDLCLDLDISERAGSGSLIHGWMEEEKISMAGFTKAKKKLVAAACKKLGRVPCPVVISFMHTYNYYLPLMYGVFKKTGSKPEKMLEFILSLPGFRGEHSSREEHFKKSRLAELKIEERIRADFGIDRDSII